MRIRLLRYMHEVAAPGRTRATWFDLVELGLVAVGFLFYFLVRGGVADRAPEAMAHAHWIIAEQRALGLFVEPLVNQWAAAAAWRVHLFNFVYFWLDFPLIVGVGVMLFRRSRRHYTLLRDALLISGAFALVLYWTFPVAPPRYLPEWGFVDTMQRYSNLSYQAQSLRPFVNPFAAVPSLHVGWALLFAIVVCQVSRSVIVRGGGVGVFVLQCVAVVATANHFLFDAVVGVMVSLLALTVAVWLDRTGYPLVRRALQGKPLTVGGVSAIRTRGAMPARGTPVPGAPPGGE